MAKSRSGNPGEGYLMQGEIFIVRSFINPHLRWVSCI